MCLCQMSSPSISIALCTYNGERYLSQQLESIASQSRLPDQLVICDDGSTDDTTEILVDFAARALFSVELHFNKKNLGSVKNFEQAIDRCGGDIIALADQDDVWYCNKLAVIASTFEDHPAAGYVFSDAELIDENGVPTGGNLWDSVDFGPLVRQRFAQGAQMSILLRRNAATGATLAFRSSLKCILLPISPYLVHDYWIALLASTASWLGVPISEVLISYRQHAGQQIGTRRMGILEKIRWVRRVGPIEYRNRIQAYVDVRDSAFAAQQKGFIVPAAHLRLLDEKIEHSSRRAEAHSVSGAAKVRQVLSEVLTGRYERFSNSWRSIAEDLCF